MPQESTKNPPCSVIVLPNSSAIQNQATHRKHEFTEALMRMEQTHTHQAKKPGPLLGESSIVKTSGRPQRPGFETSAVFPLTGTDKRPLETPCSSRSIPRHQTESRSNTRSAHLSTKEMRAALFYGKEDIRFEEVPEPVVDEGKVLVEVEWCGICGTDLHLYHLGPEVFGDLTKHGDELPRALGHEFCGRVVSPPAASAFKHGDSVMIDPRLPCGQCQACKGGRDYGCPKQGGIGYNFGGGLAQRVAVPEQNLYHLPATIPLEFAALIEPFTVATHAIAKTGIVDWTNQLVLIIGGGPVGFALMLALRAHQPRTIIVSEPTSTRRAQVANMADVTLDPLRQNVAEACREASPAGVDVVFDCAGTAAGMADGLDALRCEGTYMTVALYQQPMALTVLPLLFKHITIKFAAVYNESDMKETIRLFAEGRFRGYEQMVTKRIETRHVVEQGFKELLSNKDEHIKILVTPKPISLAR